MNNFIRIFSDYKFDFYKEILDEEELEETFSKTCNSLHNKIQGYQTTAAWRWATVKEEQKEMLALAIEQQVKVKRRK